LLSPHGMHPQPQVLLADCDSSRRRLLERALRRDGYDVLTTADGREMLAQVEYLMAVRGYRIGGRIATDSFAVVTSPVLETLSGLAVLDCIERAGWQIPTVVLPGAGPADAGQIDSVRARLFGTLHASDAPTWH
jgi:CheY-like chemotaxis protein